MSFSEISIGLTLAFIIYELIGHFFPSRPEGNLPWDQPAPMLHNAKDGSNVLTGIGKKFVFHQWFLKNEGYRSRLDLILVRSGHPFQWTVEDLMIIKIALLGIVLLVLGLDGARNPLFWVGGIYVGFQLPDAFLKARGAARQAEIKQKLPGFIDLLTLTIEGGLDLLAALERILDKMKHSALTEELMLISQETRLGTPRKEALEHWVYRTNLPDIQSLTAMIIQSEELGTSLSTVLRSYSDDMRNRRITQAEEAAGKAPLKILFPMMVFFFPIVFVVIFGPVAMSVMSTYNK